MNQKVLFCLVAGFSSSLSLSQTVGGVGVDDGFVIILPLSHSLLFFFPYILLPAVW